MHVVAYRRIESKFGRALSSVVHGVEIRRRKANTPRGVLEEAAGPRDVHHAVEVVLGALDYVGSRKTLKLGGPSDQELESACRR